MSSAHKLSGWRMSTGNALPKLQAKAIEAQAGLLSPAEATLLIASVEAIYQKLYDIASGEQFRIYNLPVAEQAHAIQHWGVLMQEPLKTKALLKVIESSLRAVVAQVEPIQVQHSPRVNQTSIQPNALHHTPPSHVSTAISYHTVLTDATQLSAANPFSPPYKDYTVNEFYMQTSCYRRVWTTRPDRTVAQHEFASCLHMLALASVPRNVVSTHPRPLSLSLSSCLHTLVARLTLRALLTLARGTSASGNSVSKLTKPLVAPATSAKHHFCRISTSL